MGWSFSAARRTAAPALLVLALLLLQRGPSSAGESPDIRLAYALATASYCAYAVNEADADSGHARAVACLRAAARADRGTLAPLLVRPDDIETYFAPERPQDAYLAIRLRRGVILAFRGSAPPPNLLPRVERPGVDLWRTFLDDFYNNFDARANERGRHAGFDDSWGRLKAHLFAPCDAASRREPCSRFRFFLGRMRPGGALYLTGHSKGGALAALAGLDMPALIGPGAAPVVYAFAAPKTVTAEIAAQAAEAAQGWWRFEQENDIVPSLPPDATVLLWVALGAPYAHLGNRVHLAPDAPPVSSRAEPFVAPGDWARWPAFFLGEAGAIAASWFGEDFPQRLLNSDEAACRTLIDHHFEALVNVRELARGVPTDRDGSFFATGLHDRAGREILWGFRHWCDWMSTKFEDVK